MRRKVGCGRSFCKDAVDAFSPRLRSGYHQPRVAEKEPDATIVAEPNVPDYR
jgi:hypothetical protein